MDKNQNGKNFKQGKPAFGGDKPAYGKGKPSFSKDKPAFGSDKPAYGQGKPYYGKGKPAYSKDKPSFNEEKPAYGKGKSSFSKDKPAFGQDKPAYGQGKPSFSKDKPTFGGDKPAYGKAKPYYSKDKPSFGQNKPPFKPYQQNSAPVALPVEKPAPAKEIQPQEEAAIENMLEGRNPIREALKAGRQIEKILVAQGEIEGSVKEIVFKARQKGIIVQEVERLRLDRVTQTGSHQGIIAYVAAKEYCEVEDILEYAKSRNEQPFIVIVDGVTDPQNLGSIIRSAECAGVHGVIIPKRRAVGLTPIVAKASAGAIEYVRVSKVTNISQTMESLKKKGIWVFGASMEGKSFTKTNLKGAVALVIGSEGEGISQLVKQRCDCLVSVPQLGKIESLNAAVSAAIIMYECVRQRGLEE